MPSHRFICDHGITRLSPIASPYQEPCSWDSQRSLGLAHGRLGYVLKSTAILTRRQMSSTCTYW